MMSELFSTFDVELQSQLQIKWKIVEESRGFDLETLSCKNNRDLSNCEIWAYFRSPHRFLLGFRSGLWLGHPQKLTFLLVKLLLCCFGCVLWVIVMLKGEIPFHLQLTHKCLFFALKSTGICSYPWFPLPRLKPQFWLKNRSPKTRCFTLDMVFFW